MGTSRTVCALVLAVALAAAASGCGSHAAAPPTSTAAAASHPNGWSIVALGDSVPSGYRCSCTPYPQLTASGLAASTGKTVTAENAAVGGFTTEDVLHQLSADAAVVDHVKKADVVEINVGANDVPYSSSGCGTAVECYAPLVPELEKNLKSIVARVHELTAGRKVLVVLLDYWSIWLGGTYARDRGHAYVSAARRLTAQVDEAVQQTAEQDGAAYVSERHAFKGPSFGYLETHYLASDGEHPNAAGHEAIAAAAEAVIRKSLAI